MKSMASALLLIAISGVAAGCSERLVAPTPAPPGTMVIVTPPTTNVQPPPPPNVAAGAANLNLASRVPAADTIVLLSSDAPFFGPDMTDVGVAARYYCSERGKLSVFVSKEHAPELTDKIMPTYSLLTYRCISPTPGQ